jgi:hypothetical protein
MSSPLALQFGSNVVTISCEDTVVRQILAHHFQYCSKGAGTAVAHFQIQQNEVGWALVCDETLLLQADQPMALLESLLQEALRQLITPEKKHLIFHAGGVSMANQGILLCGETAVGKSVLAAQLTAAGFDYLSDEVVALALTGNEMRGFARSIVLKQSAEFLWPEGAVKNDLLHLPGGTTWLAPTYLREGCVGETAAPRLILFPQFDPDYNFEVRPLSAAESGFQLMQLLVNARNLPQKGFTAVTQLAKQIPAFSLRHSSGPAVAGWLLEQLNQ